MFSAGLKLRHFYDFQFDFVDEHLANYYRYYRRYAPKVDIRIVIAVTLTIISVIQVHFVLPHCKSYLLWDKMVSYYSYLSWIQITLSPAIATNSCAIIVFNFGLGSYVALRGHKWIFNFCLCFSTGVHGTTTMQPLTTCVRNLSTGSRLLG